jgi:hypothetical protein
VYKPVNFFLMLCLAVPLAATAEPYALAGPFPQEVAETHNTEDGLPANAVHSLAIIADGIVAGTAEGMALRTKNAWQRVEGFPTEGAARVQSVQGMLAAVANGKLHVRTPDGLEAVPLPEGAVHAVLPLDGRKYFYVATDKGLFRQEGNPEGETKPAPLNELLGDNAGVNALAQSDVLAKTEGANDEYGVPWIARSNLPRVVIAATDAGLFREGTVNQWEHMPARDEYGLPWGHGPIAAAAFDHEGNLWIAAEAGVARHNKDNRWTFFRGEDGLPYNKFTCMAVAPNNDIWFGTEIGAIRWREGVGFDYRQGPRYMPHDHVNDIAVDKDGDVWFATENGLGCLRYQPMTLAEKAAVYEAEVEKYIKRTTWGFTSEVSFRTPGEKNLDGIRRTDSDNDGLWTSMYGAGACYAYAVTQDPRARERAKEAFEALRFLQTVTQGTEHSPPEGYVARTVLPIDHPDPNIGRFESDMVHREERDSLWKVYEPRWPVSADGEWYFKTDTSSDELDGHYFFYPLYYDLVAGTPEEKARVVEVVRNLTDHLMEHGWYLVDHDGTPTRWSVYAPEALNHDPNWYVERGLKSLSILSYLAVAHHMTGDEKYAEAIRTLDEEHAYVQNAMVTKVQFGVGSGNQSDDEMAIMCYYNFMKYAPDEAMRERLRYSFYKYWTIVQPEKNPFFHFAYAAHGLGQSVTNPWGTHPIEPWDGWLEDSMDTLRNFPLDRLNWPLRNSHRLDIVPLRRQQAVDPYDPMSEGRGHLVNSKVLDVENRHFNHWNTDPWRLNYGGDGRTLASGTVYLLPYYMGLYYGFIREEG